MKKTKLLNVYRCQLISDNDVRFINVVARSFGTAAKLCSDAISLWENKESYELVEVRFLYSCFTSNSL